MAGKKIKELPVLTDLNQDDDLILDQQSTTGRTRTNTLANWVLSVYNSTLGTAAKTITGAINEIQNKISNLKDETISFTQSTKRTNVATGDSLKTMFGKVSKFFTDLKPHAFNAPITTLDSTSTTDVLAASAGKSLSDRVNALQDSVDTLNSAIANMDEEVKEVDKRQTEANSQLSDTMLGIIWSLNDNKEAILKNYWDSKRDGKVYQTKLWKYSHNTSSEGVKMLDNADMVCKPSTDSIEAQDDYENIGLFQWLNCDYVRDEHGFASPTEVEGWGENFAFTGNIDVGVMGMSFYYNIDTSHPEYVLWTISDSPQDGLIPYPACVRDDGSFSPYIIHSKYISSVADDGLHRSIKNARPESFISHDKIIVEYKKKGDGYFGAGIEKSLYGIIYQVIKYGTKNSQSIMQGCTNYDFQYVASVVRETKEKFFPVTKAQANNFIVGASVIVGYGSANGESVNLERGVGTMRSYAYGSRVTKIEPIDNDNTAIYLDVEEGFDTKPVKLNDTLTANITISSWHWYSGTTDTVIGHHDGSMTSNTNAKYPYRMQGIEHAIGAYTIASDVVMEFQSDYSKKVWVAPKGVARSSNLATIKSTYTDIGTIPNVDTGADFWVADIQTNTDLMAWLPLPNAQSQDVGHGDRCYAGGTATSGLREYAIGGSLGSGSSAGSVFVLCWSGLTSAGWGFAAAD